MNITTSLYKRHRFPAEIIQYAVWLVLTRHLGFGHGNFPVCMAKTQMSFSTNPETRGAPAGHTVEISEVRLANGAGFIVAICGNMMTMPGLPKVPAAEKIDVDTNGNITGLF